MSSYLCEGHMCPHRGAGRSYCSGDLPFSHVIPHGGSCIDMKKRLRCCDGCTNEAIRIVNAEKTQGKIAFGGGE